MTPFRITDKEFENDRVVFSLGDIIKVIIDEKTYHELSKDHEDEVIVSASEEKKIINRITGRGLVYISQATGIPIYGHISFGMIDRGTNLIQVRPMTGCNLNCIFCSACEGPMSDVLKTDYIVDLDYLMLEIERLAALKGDGVEIHIDGQGEPGFYPHFKELVKRCNDLREVEVVSVQSNGFSLDPKDIKDLEGKLDRINLSLNTLKPETAKKLSGIPEYDFEHVERMIRYLSESDIDILIAPVWVPGINDSDIIEIIEFVRDNIHDNKWPSIGIQKFIPYKHGRKPNVEVMTFHRFYQVLKELEGRYDMNLILNPSDFDISYRPSNKTRFKKGEWIKAYLRAPGRKKGEMVGVARDRAISVETKKHVGDTVKCKITRTKHDIYHAIEIK